METDKWTGAGGQMEIPDGYRGREQAYIKHQLLKGYLEHLIMIVGHRRAPRISFVDCFAGPWQDESDTLGTTSIAIALDIMRRCRNAYLEQGRGVPAFRALFVERNRASFGRLRAYLGEAREGIETAALRGEFADLGREILAWCGPTDFAFFFIDPQGWKDVTMPKLRPLLERTNSEFLINLMYDFVNRAVPQAKFAEEIHELFGEDVSGVTDLSSKHREHVLLRLYQRRLREAVPATGERPYTSAVPVLDPHSNRTKYHLVYLTRHPKGIKTFVGQSEKLDIIQPQVRLQAQRARRFEKTGQYELPLRDAGQADDAAVRQIPLSTVKDYWLQKLTFHAQRFGLAEFAEMHEETGWFLRTLQAGLGELVAEGKVRNVDAKRRRTKNFVDFEQGERLVRVWRPRSEAGRSTAVAKDDGDC